VHGEADRILLLDATSRKQAKESSSSNAREVGMAHCERMPNK
jgi:hypothetical protein